MSRHWLPAVLGSLVFALSLTANDSQVHVWQDSMPLPTYRLGEPSPIPQFAILTSAIPNYPYPLLNNLTHDKQDRLWRTLNLENEYLLCRVLPDLGGHLYSCRDKRNGREMFYANPVIKPADIGLRGAWVALGIESNFPLGHTRVSLSPVDFAIREESDGSGRVIVEDTDRVTGMQWQVEYVLRPGSAVLEQRVILSNRSAVPWSHYWWADASVAFDDPAMRMILPAHVVSTHTTPSEIVPWPVMPEGKDGSVVANHKKDGAWFAYASREPFFALVKPTFRSGLAHFADPSAVVGKKFWLWGSEEDAWVKRELTDNFSSYVEMQGGLFQNQTTFESLAPEQSVQFSEFWIPLYDLGGVTRVTRDTILNLERRADTSGGTVLQIELSATRMIPNARLQVLNNSKPVLDTNVDLSPGSTYLKTLESPVDSPYTVELVDSGGTRLLRHVEGTYDADGPDRVKLGVVPKPCPDDKEETESTLLACGTFNEQWQHWNIAWSDYAIGRKKFPSNPAFGRAAGNLALKLNRFAEASGLLSTVVDADASDAASAYCLGLAQVMLGEDARARQILVKVPLSSAFSSAAALQLALLSARAKDEAGALAILKPRVDQHSGPVQIGGFAVALLRRSGQKQEALQLVNRLYAIDPADSMLRFERVLLGIEDEDLWRHLAVDGERVLNLVDEYLSLGSDEDALRLLSYSYPAMSAAEIEPGVIPAELHPMIVYYRAFVRAGLGQDEKEDLRLAATRSTTYVFPNRWSSIAVLESALKANSSDAHAHLLLGRLFLNQMEVDRAIAEWQQGRKQSTSIFPDLDRDLAQLSTELKKCPNVNRNAGKGHSELQITSDPLCGSRAATGLP